MTLTMSDLDAGLDRHAWGTEYASLEPQLEDAPRETLPDLVDLVGRMLAERGIDVDVVAGQPDSEELVAEFRSARELAERAERGEVDPGDVAAAIVALRAVYDALIAERSAP